MLIWRILCLISLIIFAIDIIIMATQGLLKNKYYHEFKEDELLKETKSVNSKNKIFFTSGETRKYIKRYALCRSAYDKYAILNFNQRFNYISYYVITYNRRNRVKNVFYIFESNTDMTSKIISLPPKAKNINIVVRNVNGIEINTNVIRPLSIKKIQLYSLLSSIGFFTFLFSLRHILIEIFGKEFRYDFITHIYDYLLILGIFIISILNYLITSHFLRRKNSKYTSGGSLEYEFL